MLKGTIGHDLHLLQDHLHEALQKGGKGVLGKAKALEGELSEIISRAESYTEQLEQLMMFSSILNSTLDTSRVRELAMKASCKLLSCEGAKEKRHFKKADQKNQFLTRNMVCVPVEAKGKLLGVLQALNRFNGPFSEADLRLLETLANQVAIAVENSLLYQNLKNQFYETVFALATAIDAKDRYTGGHTKRVALFSELIAKYMDLSKEEVEEVRLGAVLHDVGKIGIDDKVLKKDSPLEKDEWEHMKQHPDLGYKILAHVKSLKTITDGMRYHHERPDGNGYPLGLKGEEIPRIASIISVADTFDAMTSNRPYRKGLEYEVAFDEIVKNSGTQFDQKVVDAFIKAFKMERMGKKKLKDKA